MGNNHRQEMETLERDIFAMKLLLNYRREAKIASGRALVSVLALFALFYVPLPKVGPAELLLFRQTAAQLAKAFLLAAIGIESFKSAHRAYVGFSLAYLGFTHRLLDYEVTLKAAPLRRANLWYVLFKDLQAYEDELRAYVRLYRRNLEILIREERWRRVNAELAKQLENLLDRFAIESTQRETILERWHAISSPKGRKRYLASLSGKLDYGKYVTRLAVTNGPQDGTGDDYESLPPERRETADRVKLLEQSAAELTLEESRQLVDAASTASSRRVKIRLLKLALRAEEKTNAAIEAAESPEERAAEERKSTDVHFLSLQDLARERFSLANILPSRVNAVMAREIILALLAPGKRGRRFQAAYRAEDTLRVMVRRQFEVHLNKQFDPRLFRDTLAWLVNESVLYTKPKTDEQVFSLTSKMKGKSAEAQKVISTFLAFDRSLRIV